MIDFGPHLRWVVGALALFGLGCIAIGLTFGVFIGSAIQSGP